MTKVKESSCLGQYGTQEQGQCESCPLVLLCIDTAIAIDGYFDQMASWIEDAEEIEAERMERNALRSPSMQLSRLQ